MTLHQAQGLARRMTARRGTTRPRILGIVSGKGGVGKSALAINLATSAARTGARTILVDGDLGLANADLLMGLLPRHDLAQWCRGIVSLEQVVCRAPSGVEVIVAGRGGEVARRIRDAALGRPAEGLEGVVASRDLTVLDLGAGIGEDVLDLAGACDPVWLVATPEPTSLADAYATAKRLWERRPSLEIELVVNRASDRAEGERTYRALARLVERFLDRPLALRSILPEDPAMTRAVSTQVPVVLGEPDTAIARRLRLLAESMLEERRGGTRGWQTVGD